MCQNIRSASSQIINFINTVWTSNRQFSFCCAFKESYENNKTRKKYEMIFSFMYFNWKITKAPETFDSGKILLYNVTDKLRMLLRLNWNNNTLISLIEEGSKGQNEICVLSHLVVIFRNCEQSVEYLCHHFYTNMCRSK